MKRDGSNWLQWRLLRFMAVYFGFVIALVYVVEWAARYAAALRIVLVVLLMGLAAFAALRVLGWWRGRLW